MAQKSHGMSWGDVNPSSGNDNKSYMDVIDLHKFDPEWSAIRLVGSVFPIRQHWIPVQTKGGKKNFSRVCLKTLDPSAHCPYCEAGFKTSSIFLHNAIIRSIQEDKPENKKKLRIPEGQEFRKKGDTFWSPVRVVQLPSTIASKIKSFTKINKVKAKSGAIKCFDVNHPKYGTDLLISFDGDKAGTAKWDVQKDVRSPLTQEEMDYLLYDLDLVYDCIEDEDESLRTLIDIWNKSSEIITNDDCNVSSLRKLVGSSSKSSSYDDDEDDEDEEETPSRKKKSTKSSKRKPVEDDLEDEDDELDSTDDEDDDDLEEEETPSRKKKSSKSAKNRRDVDDEEDLEDDDLEDEDDDDEETSSSKKKSSKKQVKSSKRKPVEDDDDDLEDEDLEDDDDEDDEDEEETPSRKKKSTKSSKASSKSKRKPVEEDDEDDDLEDDELELDEDEEEEEIEVKKSSKKKRPGKK